VLSCSDCLARHSEYLDGIMDAGTAAQWRAHLAECAECARYDRVVRRGLTLFAAQAQLRPTPDFMTQLEQRLAYEDRRIAMRPITSLASASVAIAAMLAFAAWIPVILLATGDERMPAVVAESQPLSAASSEIAWHVESAVDRRSPEHVHFVKRVAWAPSAENHVIEPKYTPVVLESPIAPLSYSRTAYGAE
jgi:predicted anti-sigma-YlaC factor YlaD